MLKLAAYLLLSTAFVVADDAVKTNTAAEKAVPKSELMSLFNGKDMTGWQVTDCTVDIVDGAMRLKAGNGFVRSNLQYEDFILELDYKTLAEGAYDSGIYIRAEFPGQNIKRVWPDKYQVNLKQGDELNLLGVKNGGKSKGLVKERDWNHLRLTVRDSTATMEINGQPAWTAEGLDIPRGYIGFQSEVASNGGQFLFKNIKLTELGFTPLCNGTDLSGWVGATKGYTVKDGVIAFIKGEGGNLYTEKEYADFVFRFEFKLDPGSNNGLAIRAPLTGDPAYVGMEFQILDDGHPKYAKIQEWQTHGSVYGVAPANRGALKPAGEWNEQEVLVNGRHVKITLNGVVINKIDLDEAAPDGKTLDGKQHPGLSNKTGHLGFAGHGDYVEFRNLRIKELNTSDKK